MGSSLDWEQRYAGTGQLFGIAPSALLLAEQARLQPGQTVLAVADGEGRNGVWLAEQGLQVTSVDISVTAQQRATALAKSRDVHINTLCVNLLNWSWPVAQFDVITCIFLHLPAPLLRQIHGAIWQAIKPGGLLLIEGFHVDQIKRDSGGPSDPSILHSETRLQSDFPDAEILRLEPVTTRVEVNGQYQGDGAAIHFVARRPNTTN
jgi:hypothetical protein